MITIDRKDDEGSFNLKTSRQNIIYNLFYSNISEFSGYLEGIINEVTYKTILQNLQKRGWKGNYFKSYCVSMVGSGWGVSHYPQFYDRNNKNIKCYHVHMWEAVQVKRVTNFSKSHGLLGYKNMLKILS